MRENEGSIWKNDRKEKDTHPDFRGEALINGVEYWVKAWRRQPGSNPKAPALKFSFTEREKRQSTPAQEDEGSDPDDLIPF